MQTGVAGRAVERSLGTARAQAEAEVERLLEAGRAALSDGGYEGLRVDEVLKRAGLSTRAFYRHFAGKAELFLAIFEEESIRASERLAARVDREADPEAAVRTWVAAVLAM